MSNKLHVKKTYTFTTARYYNPSPMELLTIPKRSQGAICAWCGEPITSAFVWRTQVSTDMVPGKRDVDGSMVFKELRRDGRTMEREGDVFLCCPRCYAKDATDGTGILSAKVQDPL